VLPARASGGGELMLVRAVAGGVAFLVTLDFTGIAALFVSSMLLRTRRTPAGFIQPCLPSLAERPPSGPGWLHEIKHDGFRLMARRDAAGGCSPATASTGRRGIHNSAAARLAAWFGVALNPELRRAVHPPSGAA